MERLKKSEQHSIPEWFDYRSVSGLSREMQEKLTQSPSAHDRAGIANSGRDSGRGFAGECVYRNSGPSSRAGDRLDNNAD